MVMKHVFKFCKLIEILQDYSITQSESSLFKPNVNNNCSTNIVIDIIASIIFPQSSKILVSFSAKTCLSNIF